METVQLENIKEYKPVITDMKALADTILFKMDSDFSDIETFEFKCANGLLIQIEAEYKGFDYRTILLRQVYVMNDDLVGFSDYENELRGLLIDGISDLNFNSEEYFYNNTKMFG